MAATKQAVVVQASATNTAAGTTTGTGIDLSTSFGMFISAQITNGTPGPATPCTVDFQVNVLYSSGSEDSYRWNTRR